MVISSYSQLQWYRVLKHSKTAFCPQGMLCILYDSHNKLLQFPKRHKLDSHCVVHELHFWTLLRKTLDFIGLEGDSCITFTAARSAFNGLKMKTIVNCLFLIDP